MRDPIANVVTNAQARNGGPGPEGRGRGQKRLASLSLVLAERSSRLERRGPSPGVRDRGGGRRGGVEVLLVRLGVLVNRTRVNPLHEVVHERGLILQPVGRESGGVGGREGAQTMS